MADVKNTTAVVDAGVTIAVSEAPAVEDPIVQQAVAATLDMEVGHEQSTEAGVEF